MFKSEAATATMKLQFPLNEMEADLRTSMSGIRKRNHDHHHNKRRFNDDQIRSLETIFQTQARPELRMKQQLANNLGLQPRQVAIWFQNKRARSKSKQIEREYNTLKASYDNLTSSFESVKKENQSLLIQLQKLRKLSRNVGHQEYETENDNIHFKTNEKPNPLREKSSCKLHLSTCNDTREEVHHRCQQDTPCGIPQIPDDSITSIENGYSFESNELLDNSDDYSHLWEF